MKKSLWLPMLLLICIWHRPARGADLDGFSVRTWQIPDGSTNAIFGLAQSPDGYLWIGTTGGLNRFDGVDYETHQLGSQYGLSDSRVRMLLTSRSGGLWVVLDRAVVLLRLNQAPIVIKENIPPQRIESMVEQSDGVLWLGYRFGPIVRIKDGTPKTFDDSGGFPQVDSARPSLALDDNGVVWLARGQRLGTIHDDRYVNVKEMPGACFIARASGGGIWVCCDSIVSKFRGNVPKDVAKLPIPRGRVDQLRLFEDRAGALWIGTSSEGLFRFDGTALQNIATPQAQINCLDEDQDGNIWVGTESGLDRVSPRAIETENAQTGLPLGGARSICQTPDGQIWAIMASGAVMQRREGGWVAAPFTIDEIATCMTSDSSGTIWIGTQNRRLYRWKGGLLKAWDRAMGLDDHTITAIFAAKNGDVWIGSTASTTLQCLRGDHFENLKIPQGNGQVDALAEDQNGSIWVGRTGNGGLLRIDHDQVTVMTPAVVGDWSVHNLLFTPDGTLWIATYARGVARMKNGRINAIGAEQGLIHTHISQLVSDGRGWLWFGTDDGVFRASEQELNDCAEGRRSQIRCIGYGGDEGLPPLQARYGQSPNCLRSTDGRVWLTMATTVAIIRPDRVREKQSPPKITLQRVVVDDRVVAAAPSYFSAATDKSLSLENALKLEPGYHHLEFNFTSPTFNSPEETRFRFRLENFEDTWNEVTNPRKAVYPRLPAGDYVFRVIAADANGNLDEQGVVARIHVAPFFWQTWWFVTLATLAVIGLLVPVMRFVALRRLRRRLQILEQRSALDRERARIARDIHDDLGHGLTQIVLLSDLENEERPPADELNEQLRQIAVTAKQGIKSLDETVWAINPRNDTLPDVIDYLGEFVVQSVRAAGIRCELNLPDHPPTITVPSEVRHNLFLAVKEAVNNSLRHAQANKVTLTIHLDGQTIQIRIADDGLGFDPKAVHSLNGDGQHDGLRNMQQRMLDVGGSFDLESVASEGTRVTLKLNLANINHNVVEATKADSYADHSLHR